MYDGTMKLCNYSNTDYHVGWYENKWQGLVDFLKDNKLDGIELLLHGNENIEEVPKDIVKGLHLSYFPTWLEFYTGQSCLEDFPTKESLVRAFGGESKEAIHQRFSRDFDIAKRLATEYMIYHVGHVTIKEAYSFDFSYSNKDVLRETLNIVNDVFKGQGPALLFENLWWPGLTLLNKEEIEWFMENVTYENKGIMLDLSHLLITNPNIKNMDQAVDYILEVLSNLGDTIKWIKGIHVNGTLIYDYMKEDHLTHYETYLKASEEDRFMEIYKHISSMDQHIPFSHPRLNEIISVVKPKYQMIEVVGRDRETWEAYVKEQLRYL